MAGVATISFDAFTNNVFAGRETLCGSYATANTLLGYASGLSADTEGSAVYGFGCNVALGTYTCSSAANSMHTLVAGYEGAKASVSLIAPLLVGARVGVSLQDTRDSIYIGFEAGLGQTTGKNNVMLGTYVGSNRDRIGGYSNTCNLVLGISSFQNASDCACNVLLGHALQVTNLCASLAMGGFATSISSVSKSILVGTDLTTPSGTTRSILVGHSLSVGGYLSNSLVMGLSVAPLSTPYSWSPSFSLNASNYAAAGLSVPNQLIQQSIVLGQGVSTVMIASIVSDILYTNIGDSIVTSTAGPHLAIGGRPGMRATPNAPDAQPYYFPRVTDATPNLLEQDIAARLPRGGSATGYDYVDSNPKQTIVIPATRIAPTIGFLDASATASDRALPYAFAPDTPIVTVAPSFTTKEILLPAVYTGYPIAFPGGRTIGGFRDKFLNGKYNSELTFINLASNKVVLYGNFLIRGNSTLSYTLSDFVLKNHVRVYDQVTRPYRYTFDQYSSQYSNAYTTASGFQNARLLPSVGITGATSLSLFPEELALQMLYIRDADPVWTPSNSYRTLSFFGYLEVNDDWFLGGTANLSAEAGSFVPLPQDPWDPASTARPYYIVNNVSSSNLSTRYLLMVPQALIAPDATLSLGATFRLDSYKDLSDFNPGSPNDTFAEYIRFYYGDGYTGSYTIQPSAYPMPTRYDTTYQDLYFCKLSTTQITSNAAGVTMSYEWFHFAHLSRILSEANLPASPDPGAAFVFPYGNPPNDRFVINVGGLPITGADPPESVSNPTWIPWVRPSPTLSYNVSDVFDMLPPSGVVGGSQEQSAAADVADFVNARTSFSAFAIGSNTILPLTEYGVVGASTSVSESLVYPLYTGVAVGTLSV